MEEVIGRTRDKRSIRRKERQYYGHDLVELVELLNAYLHVFQAVLLTYAPQNILLTALLHFAGQQKLVKNEVGLLEIEDDVQLADVAVVFIHLLHVAVDNLEGDEFIVGGGASSYEEKRGIAAVDYLGI